MWTWPDRFGLSPTALAFNERDWILISDFENLTGDQVFDRSLRVALEVGIAQSQYVNVLPPQRVQSALQRMQRAPGDRLDEALASEVAVREGVRAVLSCSIAQVGGVYALTARVIDPQSQSRRADPSRCRRKARSEILAALDELASAVRSALGESLPSISTERAVAAGDHIVARGAQAVCRWPEARTGAIGDDGTSCCARPSRSTRSSPWLTRSLATVTI